MPAIPATWKHWTRFYTGSWAGYVVGSFEGHDGINGVMIGPTGAQWHLEFTESAEPPVHAFDEEDNLVFYPADRLAYDTILERIRSSRFLR